jgi:hypothetical protein
MFSGKYKERAAQFTESCNQLFIRLGEVRRKAEHHASMDRMGEILDGQQRAQEAQQRAQDALLLKIEGLRQEALVRAKQEDEEEGKRLQLMNASELAKDANIAGDLENSTDVGVTDTNETVKAMLNELGGGGESTVLDFLTIVHNLAEDETASRTLSRFGSVDGHTSHAAPSHARSAGKPVSYIAESDLQYTGKVLGKGGNGEVREAKIASFGNELVAVKTILLKHQASQDEDGSTTAAKKELVKKSFQAELDIHQKLRSQPVLQVYGSNVQELGRYYIVSERMHKGSLADCIK